MEWREPEVLSTNKVISSWTGVLGEIHGPPWSSDVNRPCSPILSVVQEKKYSDEPRGKVSRTGDRR